MAVLPDGVMEGAGFELTVTLTVLEIPEQPLCVTVQLYTAVCEATILCVVAPLLQMYEL